MQFFLDLWQDIKDLPFDGLDEDTITAIDALQSGNRSKESTLFSGYAAAFQGLSDKAGEMLVKHTVKEVLSELKVYGTKCVDP